MKFFRSIVPILFAGILLVFGLELPKQASAQTNLEPIGIMDSPLQGSVIHGEVALHGWFLDGNGVSKTEVLVDGKVVGQAAYGEPRPDVKNAYPQYNNGNSGFYFTLDTTKFADGEHSVTVRETGMSGHVTTLPERKISIFNVKGYLDVPNLDSILTGTTTLSGWFLDMRGVAKIEVFVDGNIIGQATYGDPRGDVHRAFPQFNNQNAGFHFSLDTTQYSDGRHTVTIKETGMNGHVSKLPERTITIANVKGYMDSPEPDAILTGIMNVSGWFLDGSSVEKIEVLIDGNVVGQASYGDPRDDVHKAFPKFNNRNAGYHFSLDTTQFSDGNHSFTIRETGMNGHVTTLPERSITIANIKGYMDNPNSNEIITGTKSVSGWFLDGNGVAKIEVLIDGTVAGEASYGDERDDVKKAFPQFHNGNAGYHFDLDTTKYSDGDHTIAIRETGMSGRVTTLPERTVTFANVKGYMDYPKVDAILTGSTNVSGWFLDGSGAAKIEVLLDGNVVGQATYGDRREDIQRAFPQFNNRDAGYHFSLDTTNYNDGKHSITIRETGMNGYVTTLPERTITIKNDVGYMDNPVAGKTYRGSINVSGWYLHMKGVSKVEVLVDGTIAGQATYGEVRKDVQRAYPQYNNGNSGYHFSLDSTKYSDGIHTISLKVTGKDGQVTTTSDTAVLFKQGVAVFLDPGHGGTDPGAISGGYHEADLNFAVAKKVESLLLDRGYVVYMSRDNDTTVGLLERSQMSNNLHPDIFVSIHHNSTGSGSTNANGLESYFYEYNPNYPSKINESMHNNLERIAKSVTLANLIHENIIAYTGASDRGTDGETFSVLRESAVPATLIECGFINNSGERQRLITDSYQSQIAKAIADGIDEYFRVY